MALRLIREGIFFRYQVYKREGIPQVEVYTVHVKGAGKSVI